MSYDYRDGDAPYGASDGERGYDRNDMANSRGGSVRAARQRLHAAQRAQTQGIVPPNYGRGGLPSRPNQLVSQFSVPGHQQDDGWTYYSNASTSSLSNKSGPGAQWPLRDDEDEEEDEDEYYQPTRKTPPARPARPKEDSSKSSHLQPQQYQYPAARAALRSPKDSWQEDDNYLSPNSAATNSSRPITTSSQGSNVSSLGSIPDFPVPVQPTPRRSPNLGPPPSARKGPSSYYSQQSHVSPIVEESEGTRSHNSMASSNVIPTDAPEFFYDDEVTPSEEGQPVGVEDGRRSRAEDHDDQSNLVRKASLGRRTRPSLTTIKSGDTLRSDSIKGDKRVGGAGADERGISNEQSRQLGSGTGLLDPSSSSSEESLSSLKRPKQTLVAERLGTPPNRGRPQLSPLSGLSSDSSLDKEAMLATGGPLQPKKSLSERAGTRRPPRLNIDAVREAEARGSLTSLPDLIRRATRVAANLERGKTASRLGMDFFEHGAPEKQDNRRSGSLSDMLSAFPPPGLATPNNVGSPSRPGSRWPNGADWGTSSGKPGSSLNRRPRRRCCGMPLWGFILLILILFLLIAAAVVIPVVLIVLPRQNNAAAPVAQPNSCTKGPTCQNGGVAVPDSNGSCRCLCSNGFTGATCTTAGDSGCTTQNFAGVDKATLGSAIPRLLQGARDNFSIPLDAASLLAEFSSANLSCTAENALVNFNGLSQRSLPPELPLQIIDPPQSAPSYPFITPGPLALRDSIITVTSNGIVFEVTAAPPSPSGTATDSTGTIPSASASATPTGTPSSNSDINNTVLDFARVGVLFVLQEVRELNPAVTAQSRLQTFFEDPTRIKGNDAKNLTIGSGYTINLVDFRITTSNGTTVGGSKAS
jgi:hypothetical protein